MGRLFIGDTPICPVDITPEGYIKIIPGNAIYIQPANNNQ